MLVWFDQLYVKISKWFTAFETEKTGNLNFIFFVTYFLFIFFRLNKVLILVKMSTTLKASHPNLKEFKKDLCSFYSFDSFYLKIITILLLIFRDGKNYWFCQKYPAAINYMVCPMCEIPMYFWNYKSDLKKIEWILSLWSVTETSYFPSCVNVLL